MAAKVTRKFVFACKGRFFCGSHLFMLLVPRTSELEVYVVEVVGYFVWRTGRELDTLLDQSLS